jgi:hypothetical protein
VNVWVNWYGLGYQREHATIEQRDTAVKERDAALKDRDQALKERDQENRDRSDRRAEIAGLREYNLKIYDKVFDSIQDSEKRRIALVLVETVSDPDQKGKLLSILGAIAENEPQREAVRQLQDVAQGQKEIGGVWAYGINWCSANPENTPIAQKVLRALQPASPRYIDQRPFNASDVTQITPRPSGQEIRFVEPNKAQASVLRSYLERVSGTDFKLVPVQPRTVLSDFIGIWICR